MQDVPKLSPLVSYQPIPLWIALGLIFLTVIIVGEIFWLTRRKPQKVLSTLPPAPVVIVDTTKLKQKYLAEIERVEQSYNAHKLKARFVHQELSRLLKLFVSEAAGAPVQTMTLSDLKRTRHTTLVPAIELFYRPEFAEIESGNVTDALSLAKKVVTEWS